MSNNVPRPVPSGLSAPLDRFLRLIVAWIKEISATDIAYGAGTVGSGLDALDSRVDTLEGATPVTPSNGFLFDTPANDYLYDTDGTPLWNPI